MLIGFIGRYHSFIYPILALLLPLGEAFVVHKQVGRHSSYKEHVSNVLSSKNIPIVSSNINNAVRPMQAHPVLVSPLSFLTADSAEMMTNVLIGIGGVVVVFWLVVLVFTLFIVPAVVKEVEKLAREFDPALWQEYEQKLKPGETLAQRPELLEEIGAKVLELQRKANRDEDDQWELSRRIAAEAEVVPEVRNTPTTTGTSESLNSLSTDDGSSIDIEVISKNKWDD